MVLKTVEGRPARTAVTLAGVVEPTRDRGDRRTSTRGDDTRARVIREAAACVIEEGFAAASANRIAQRAGVTWGVIQYHFGDRAGLLSAVVLAGYEHWRRSIEGADIPPGPIRPRIEAVVDAGWRAYGSPLGRASLEILVNTRAARDADPEHAAELIELARGLHRLAEQLIFKDSENQPRRRAAERLLWAALRGFALTLMMATTDYDFAAERATLVDVLASYLEEPA